MDTDDANANSNAAAENNDIMIKLISAEDDSTGESQVFEISLAAAGLSVLVVDAAGDVEDDDDDDDDDDDNARNKPPLEINISRVKGPCLAKVVDFMNHHHTDKMKAIPTPLGGSSFNEVSLFCLFVRSPNRTVDRIVLYCIVLYCIVSIRYDTFNAFRFYLVFIILTNNNN